MGGEKETISEVYRRFGDVVFRRCMRFLGHSDDCRDIVQEVFARYIRHSDGIEATARLAWLLTTADRLCLDSIRNRSTRDRLLGIFGVKDEVAASPYDDIFANRELLKELASQKKIVRDVLVRHYVHGESLSEVARNMDLNPRRVQRMHQRFLVKARNRFGLMEEPES